MRNYLSILVSVSAMTLAGCTSLAPGYDRPDLPINAQLPDGPDEGLALAEAGWRDVIIDPQLAELIERALQNNRDLRVATANVRLAEARYGIQRAARLPSIAAGVSVTDQGTFDTDDTGTIAPGDAGTVARFGGDQASAQLAVTAYEVDLFGRVASLNQAAQQRYFAAVENARAAHLSLIGATANAYIGLIANERLLALAVETASSQERSLELSQALFDAGVSDDLDLQRARISVERARADISVFTANVAASRNALQLLVGEAAPISLSVTPDREIRPVQLQLAAGQNSDILLSRPDVLAAERNLRAANADIGAARAAFFPRITLAGSAGYASTELDGLFTDGFGVWSYTPQVSLPIFTGGANRANLKASKAQRDIAVAQYERAVQSAFRETADALAVAETVDERINALQRLADAGERALYLSEQRFQRGVDDYLTVLDAQRSYYQAEQALISARADRARNAVALYQAIGGRIDPDSAAY